MLLSLCLLDFSIATGGVAIVCGQICSFFVNDATCDRSLTFYIDICCFFLEYCHKLFPLGHIDIIISMDNK